MNLQDTVEEKDQILLQEDKEVEDKLLKKLKEKGIGHQASIPRKIKNEIEKIQKEEEEKVKKD